MFGDLMGNMEEKQNAMKAKLATVMVSAEAGDGAVQVTSNANGEITNIAIKKEMLDLDDIEQLEDYMMVAVNRALEKAAAKEAIEAENLMKDMLPPGMGGLGNLFGG